MGWNGTNSNTDLTADVWMTLAITNTTSNTHIMYLNGVADGTGSFSGGASNPISGMAILNNEISPTQNDKIIVDSVVVNTWFAKTDGLKIGCERTLRAPHSTYLCHPTYSVFLCLIPQRLILLVNWDKYNLIPLFLNPNLQFQMQILLNFYKQQNQQ
jgi:hypothetical protein